MCCGTSWGTPGLQPCQACFLLRWATSCPLRRWVLLWPWSCLDVYSPTLMWLASCTRLWCWWDFSQTGREPSQSVVYSLWPCTPCSALAYAPFLLFVSNRSTLTPGVVMVVVCCSTIEVLCIVLILRPQAGGDWCCCAGTCCCMNPGGTSRHILLVCIMLASFTCALFTWWAFIITHAACVHCLSSYMLPVCVIHAVLISTCGNFDFIWWYSIVSVYWCSTESAWWHLLIKSCLYTPLMHTTCSTDQ